MIPRHDLLACGRAPEAYQKALLNIGGRTPFGEPNYRFVLAECVYKLEGGEWTEWPKGANLSDRGGLQLEEGNLVETKIAGGDLPGTPWMNCEEIKVLVPDHRPLRTVVDTRWVRKYPHIQGWILQEWYPAKMYGSPEYWATFTVPGHDNICRLGPYPTYGDYELAAPCLGGRQGKLPTVDQVEEAIQYIHSRRSYWASMSPEVRIQLRMDEMAEIAETQKRWDDQRNRDMIREQMSPYWGSSLTAGRLRTELAERAGLRSHVGN